MEQAPVLGSFFHVRMVSVISILCLADTLLVAYAARSLYLQGHSMQLLFGFEVCVFAASNRFFFFDDVCSFCCGLMNFRNYCCWCSNIILEIIVFRNSVWYLSIVVAIVLVLMEFFQAICLQLTLLLTFSLSLKSSI